MLQAPTSPIILARNLCAICHAALTVLCVECAVDDTARPASLPPIHLQDVVQASLVVEVVRIVFETTLGIFIVAMQVLRDVALG